MRRMKVDFTCDGPCGKTEPSWAPLNDQWWAQPQGWIYIERVGRVLKNLAQNTKSLHVCPDCFPQLGDIIQKKIKEEKTWNVSQYVERLLIEEDP